jgi:hypothetical protein
MSEPEKAKDSLIVSAKKWGGTFTLSLSPRPHHFLAFAREALTLTHNQSIY